VHSPWEEVELDYINSALSAAFDVTTAKGIEANAQSAACYQGQTHGHKGFLLTPTEAQEALMLLRLVSLSLSSLVYFTPGLCLVW
jgi:hypothetical protein